MALTMKTTSRGLKNGMTAATSRLRPGRRRGLAVLLGYRAFTDCLTRPVFL